MLAAYNWLFYINSCISLVDEISLLYRARDSALKAIKPGIYITVYDHFTFFWPNGFMHANLW